MSVEPQPDLFSQQPRHAENADLEWIEKLLHGAQCWMTAKDIMLTVAGRVHDRDIRELASSSKKIISGQRGYKHVAHATAAEIDHSANWLISQGKKMIRRGIGQRRYAHEIFG